MESILDAISDDSMASVGATIESSAEVIVLGQDVDKLALAFVAPLRAKNDGKFGVHATLATIGSSLE